MAADALELLFRIKSDSSQAVGDVKKLRAAFASELQGVQKAAASVSNPAGRSRNVAPASPT